MRYVVYLHSGRKAVCPKCAGMLVASNGGSYRCVDCGTAFDVLDTGSTDNEVVCRERRETTR